MKRLQKFQLKRREEKNKPAVASFRFTSLLTKDHLPALQCILFFNPQQNRYAEEIMQVIEANGIPNIIVEHNVIRIRIGAQEETHTIFALTATPTEKLVGLVLFSHPEADQIMIQHIAVDFDYSFRGVFADAMLTWQLIQEVVRLAAKVKGVTKVGIMYGRRTGHTLYLPVQRKANEARH